MADENVDQGTETPEETVGAVDGVQTTASADAEAVEAEVSPDAEPVTETDEEPVAEELAAEAEEPAAEAQASAPAAEEHVAEAEEPAAEAEAPAPVEEVVDLIGDLTVRDAPAAPARKKKKRLPRALRPKRTKPKREVPKERKPITRLPKPEHVRGRRLERQGTVVSAAADKTIVVRVDVVKAHRMYKKVIRRSTKLHVHDEGNQAKVGDIVRIVETRPISRMKRWRLHEIVEAAK